MKYPCEPVQIPISLRRWVLVLIAPCWDGERQRTDGQQQIRPNLIAIYSGSLAQQETMVMHQVSRGIRGANTRKVLTLSWFRLP